MNERSEFTGPHANCTKNNRPAGGSSDPTLPKRLWTMNRLAIEDSVADIYRFHPWRAPGSAPVTDACGTAGGTSPAFEGPGDARFKPVPDQTGSMIRQGDLGSVVLTPGPPTATFQRGGVAEVKWGLRFNHGGGYQYRLCPSSMELTEDCFNEIPLDFVRGRQAIELNNSTRWLVPVPEYIDEGVIPVGGTWARNPIPVISGQHHGCPNATSANATDNRGMHCRQFDPPCLGDDGWSRVPGSQDPTDVNNLIYSGASGRSLLAFSIASFSIRSVSPLQVMGACSGNWISGLIVDEVVIPTHIAPGRYVLGFRWDCEQTRSVI